MSTAVLESINTTAVFELVRYIGGTAVPYVPYQSDCAGCCAPAAAPAAAPVRSCCGH